MKTYNFWGRPMVVDLLSENVMAVIYKNQIGYVGFNLASDAYLAYTHTINTSYVTDKGLYVPSSQQRDFESSLKKVCDDLMIKQTSADHLEKNAKYDAYMQYTSSLAIVDFYRLLE